MASDLFGARASLAGMPDLFRINRLDETGAADTQRLPHHPRILLEGLLRNAGRTARSRRGRCSTRPGCGSARALKRVPFFPARVLLQDFTGVPAVVDLAAMRAAMARAGSDPARVDPLVPCDLVIDHSVQVDEAGTLQALRTTSSSSTGATASATRCCAGPRAHSARSAWCRRAWGSCTR